LGGHASYVIVNGNSMEPTYYRGDLIILAEASSYSKGDIVTYKDHKLGAYVIHRIIGKDGEKYILKGDHNYWIDATHPSQSEIIGKQWIHIPDVGDSIIWMRKPSNMAFVLFILGTGVILSMVVQPNQTSKAVKKPKSVESGAFEMILYFFTVLTFVFLVAAVYSFTRPLTKQANKIPYVVSGEYLYSAAGSPTIYDGGTVSTGEPVFIKLTCLVDLEYQYLLTAEKPEAITGTQFLSVNVIDEKSGWQRKIPLTQEQSFSGNSLVSRATLDICKISEMIKGVETETGFKSSSYDLQVISNVKTQGIISGQLLLDNFSHVLSFTMDSTHLYLNDINGDGAPTKLIKEKLLDNPTMVENTINLKSVQVPVKMARGISVIGLSIFLACVILLGYYFQSLGKINKAKFNQLKYGSMIIDASIVGLDRFNLVIDVKSIDELVKIANRQNSMILHFMKDHTHYYLVEHEDTAYRYTFKDEKIHTPTEKIEPPEPPATILGRFQ